MGYWYRVGTVSVTNGSATVTGSLTGWLSQVYEGDALVIAGELYEIQAATTNTSITLVQNFSGTTGSGLSYAIVGTSPLRASVMTLNQKITDFIESATDIFGGTGAPSVALGGDGSLYFRDDTNQLYKKASGSWGTPISLVGPPGVPGPTGSTGGPGPANTLTIGTVTTGSAGSSAAASVAGTAPTQQLNLTIPRGDVGATGATGPQGIQGIQGVVGPSYAATSVSSITIGTGTKTFTTQAGLAYQAGTPVRVASTASPTTAYMDGVCSSYSGTSLIVEVSYVAGSGTLADWKISVTGERGPTGSTGPTGATGPTGQTYATTSTTSVTVGLGSKVFTVASGLAYIGSERVRIISASNEDLMMTGLVTTYATTTLTVDVDAVGVGTGSATDWRVSVTGEKGDQGPSGGFSGLSATKGNLVSGNGTSFVERTVGTNGQVLVADSTQSMGIAWASIASEIRPNLLINSDFRINVRGYAGGSVAANTYTVDRWKIVEATGSATIASGVATISSGAAYTQIVEPACWGYANLASTAITVSVSDPSADITVTVGSVSGSITAGSGRRSVTITTSSGDTSTIQVKFKRTAAGTVSFGFPRAEVGSVAAPWVGRDLVTETLLCERYYHRIGAAAGHLNFFGYGLGSSFSGTPFLLPAPMRAAPTITKFGTWYASNCAQPSFGSASVRGFHMQTAVTATGAFQVAPDSADDYIELNAEL